jgi:hypothetical protein
MRFHQIIGGIPIQVSNEERDFIKEHGDTISLEMLDEHQEHTAQNLVRKGVYSISKDRRYIFRIDKTNE